MKGSHGELQNSLDFSWLYQMGRRVLLWVQSLVETRLVLWRPWRDRLEVEGTLGSSWCGTGLLVLAGSRSWTGRCRTKAAEGTSHSRPVTSGHQSSRHWGPGKDATASSCSTWKQIHSVTFQRARAPCLSQRAAVWASAACWRFVDWSFVLWAACSSSGLILVLQLLSALIKLIKHTWRPISPNRGTGWRRTEFRVSRVDSFHCI